jgi:hypothetical protein
MAATVSVKCVAPLLAILAALSPAMAGAQRRAPDQDRARAAMQMGARPLRDIQQEWRQGMPGYDYLGSDYDANAGNYRLKFLRDGSVSYVDVDGRTGREIGRSRH